MSSFIFVERILKKASQTVGASETDTAITSSFPVSDIDAKDISVIIKYDDATVAAGITAKLQTTHDGGTTWKDHNTVAITGAVATTTRKYIDMNEAVATTNFPLYSRARVVVTSGAGDSVVVDSVYVSRRTRS